MLLAFIEWSVSPEIFHLGPVSVRWYGFLFAMAFVAGYFIMTWVFKKKTGRSPNSNSFQFI